MKHTVITFRDTETENIIGQETNPASIPQEGDEHTVNSERYKINKIVGAEDRKSNVTMLTALVSKLQ
jgi:hypothetical protein